MVEIIYFRRLSLNQRILGQLNNIFLVGLGFLPSTCGYERVIDYVKVGTHEGLVLATNSGRRDLSHEQFTRSVLRNKSQGTCPKNSNWFEFMGLVAGIKVGPVTRF